MKEELKPSFKTIPQFTKEEAIALAESKWWLKKGTTEIAIIQLFQEKLNCQFDVFHEAIEKTLERPVFTHEFAEIERLQDEMQKKLEYVNVDFIISVLPDKNNIFDF